MGNCFRLTVHLPSSQLVRRRTQQEGTITSSLSAGTVLFNRKTLSLGIIGLLLLMGVFYLILVNIRVTRGFQIKQLQRQLAALQREHKELEVESAQLQSIQNIQARVDKNQFVPSGTLKFTKSGDVAMTDRR